MVLALELTKEEVLERLKKILKGVSVIPHTVSEYHADNLPPAMSCFTSASTFLYIFFIVVLSVFNFLLNLSPLVVLFIYMNWGVTLLIRSPLMTTLLG
jgi:hypothetical protein